MEKVARLAAVREILRSSPRRINKIFLSKEAPKARFKEILDLSRQANVPVVFVPHQKLDQLSSLHQGIVALIATKEFVSLQDILQATSLPFLVFLDEIVDPQNLGAIIRSAEAAGVDGLILPERHSVGLTAAVYHASAGALEQVKVARVKNLVRALEEVKKHGLWVIGAETRGQGLWFEFDYTLPIALVFGSEGRGLRQLVRRHCDRILSIPLVGQVNSLNVAAAAAVFLFEVRRQRLFAKK
ncbi:MAG: 23S rRNA (guanosine(2251)-2'-O)-methyltransferase RlmB [Candidatus Aminicenantes bacterium]|nr:23S rRNA (guanosine(2251)-2'-O)-methyltransferase RlmB [Candidatus Aminicenantes bacterium]